MSGIADFIAGLTDEQQAEVIRAVLKFPLPQKSFLAWAECTNTCPMEYCILDPEMQNILLFKRPDSDPVFGGQWHISGGLMLPTDMPEDIWPKLWKGPKYGLANATFKSGPIKIGVIDTAKGPQSEGKCPRSKERNIIHAIVCTNGANDSSGEWFPLDALPRTGEDMLLGHHQKYVDEILLEWLAACRK